MIGSWSTDASCATHLTAHPCSPKSPSTGRALQRPARTHRPPAHQGRARDPEGALATRPHPWAAPCLAITVTAVLAIEAHPPGDEDLLDWLLLTNLAAGGRHPRAGDRKALLVPLPLADRGLLQGPQERLPDRGAAVGETRAPRAGAGLL